MSCPSCQAFAGGRAIGAFQKGCFECDARHISDGIGYWQSQRAGRMLPDYQAALKSVFGELWNEGHQAAKRYAKGAV